MRPLRWLPWVSLAALFLLLLCHEWYGPDIWYHLYLGGRVAQTLDPQPPDNLILQQPDYVNLYWLFQLLVRGAYGLGGIRAVSLLFIAAWAIAAGYWLNTAGLFAGLRPRGGPARAATWGPIVALGAGLLCQTRFEQRPEVASYVFLAMQIHWLSRWDPGRSHRARDYAKFALAQALWTNMHGYFVFGPALAGLKAGAGAAARWLGRGRADPGETAAGAADGRPLPGLLLFLVLLAASLVSPFGLRGWAEVLEFGRVLRRMRFEIQELLPLSMVPRGVWVVDLYWALWLATFAAATWAAVGIFRRRDAGGGARDGTGAGPAATGRLFAFLLACFGLYISSVAYRNMPLLVFLGAPLAGAWMGSPGRTGGQPARRGAAGGGRATLAALAVSAAAAALAVSVVTGGFYRRTGSGVRFGIRVSDAAFPVEFADHLRAHPFAGALFDSPEDGGYLEFHFPALRLYGDSRIVDVALSEEYFRALRDPAAFRALQDAQSFDGALLSTAESPDLIRALQKDPAWRLAYVDRHRVLFVAASGRR